MTAPPKRPPRRKSERTRERILDAAAVVFRARGLAGTRLSDVADEAGLQAPSLYYHFASKEQLMEEVLALGVRRTFDRVQAEVAAVPADQPRQRLAVAIRTHVAMVLETGNYSAANLRLYGQIPEDIRARLEAAQEVVGRYWHELLAAAVDAGQLRADLDLSAARMLLLGSLNWTAEWYDEDGGLSPQQLAEQAATLLLDGLTHANDR